MAYTRQETWPNYSAEWVTVYMLNIYNLYTFEVHLSLLSLHLLRRNIIFEGSG